MAMSAQDNQKSVHEAPANLLYDPLPEGGLRLIQIPDNDVDEPIECTLETFSAAEIPKYVALSYVWSDPHDTEEIEVNG
jgi:hypothetical protein